MATAEPKIWRTAVLYSNDSRRSVCEGRVLQKGIFSVLRGRQTVDCSGRMFSAYSILVAVYPLVAPSCGSSHTDFLNKEKKCDLSVFGSAVSNT